MARPKPEATNYHKRAYRLASWIGGRPASSFPVGIRFNNSQTLHNGQETIVRVVARSAREAGAWVRDRLNRPETEITVYGPQGGKAAYFYIGWESAIGRELWRGAGGPRAGRLPFDPEG